MDIMFMTELQIADKHLSWHKGCLFTESRHQYIKYTKKKAADAILRQAFKTMIPTLCY